MITTLATGIETAAAIAALIGAAATTTTTIMAAQSANARANRAAAAAAKKAALDKLAQDSAAAQQRSLAARRLATQVDSARVTAGAAGVSSGASQMVLESSFSTAAKTDIAMIEANRARGNLSTDINFENNLNSIDGSRINPLAAGMTGIAQGIGTFTTINDGINSLSRPSPTTPAPEVPFAGGNIEPATGVIVV